MQSARVYSRYARGTFPYRLERTCVRLTHAHTAIRIYCGPCNFNVIISATRCYVSNCVSPDCATFVLRMFLVVPVVEEELCLPLCVCLCTREGGGGKFSKRVSTIERKY